MLPEDYVFINPLIYQRYLFMADKIERQPELLEIPLANIERWIAMDRLGDVRPLIQWREMIEGAQASGVGRRARDSPSCWPSCGTTGRRRGI